LLFCLNSKLIFSYLMTLGLLEISILKSVKHTTKNNIIKDTWKIKI